MVMHSDSKAYLFTGRQDVDFFDLKTQRWGFIRTTYDSAGPWPYPSSRVVDYTMQCVSGKLYVFGGMHCKSNAGCDLFMELDI